MGPDKANDSQECRNCHRYDYMDFTEQGNRAAKMHPSSLSGFLGKPCQMGFTLKN